MRERRCESALRFITVLALVALASAISWLPDPACVSECSLNGNCSVSSTFTGSCPAGWTAAGPPTQEVDEATCGATECSKGGCPPERPVEQKSKSTFCVSTDCGPPFVCVNEWCCAIKDIYTCTQDVPCKPVYADCMVPSQQTANSSVSNVTLKQLHHDSDATFPFYANATMPSDQPCVKVWGSCHCHDGQLQPGCNASDSATWVPLDKSAATLPPGLSLTCFSLSGCHVPHQTSNDSSVSSLHSMPLPHGAQATLPFYAAPTVPFGQPCSAVWGSCTCDNGALMPGCDAADSSTWLSKQPVNGTLRPLPAGLSLTCAEAGPPPSDDGGKQQQGAQGGEGKGWMVAGIASAGALLVLALCSGAMCYFRAHVAFKRWFQQRLGSSYQPVMTGYSPPGSGNSPPSKAAFGSVHDALGNFRSIGGGFRRQPRAAGLQPVDTGSPRAGSRSLPYPAAPEDDVFTLEDLESPSHHDHYPQLPVSRGGKAEVELNSSSTYRERERDGQQHTSLGGAGRSHRSQRTAQQAQPPDKQPLLGHEPDPNDGPSASSLSFKAGVGLGKAPAVEIITTRQVNLDAREDDDNVDEESGLVTPTLMTSGKGHRKGGHNH